MRPVPESPLTIGYHSRTDLAFEMSREFCEATSFVQRKKTQRLEITRGILAHGLGSVAVATIMSNWHYVAGIGNCRINLLRSEGGLTQITLDHHRRSRDRSAGRQLNMQLSSDLECPRCWVWPGDWINQARLGLDRRPNPCFRSWAQIDDTQLVVVP